MIVCGSEFRPNTLGDGKEKAPANRGFGFDLMKMK